MKARTPANRAAFAQVVYDIVRCIPIGRVMTYGDISRLIPAPAGLDPIAYRRIGPRWVGYAMADCPEDVPWHRVVNARGRISPRPTHGPHIQKETLQQEGIPFDGERIPLDEVRWIPPSSLLHDMGLTGREQP